MALGQHHVEVVDEQAAPLQARGLGGRDAGHVVHHRHVGGAAAEPLDRLASLELEHLDDEPRVRAAQVTDRRRHEGRQGAGEGGEPQAARAAAQILHRGLGAAQRGEHPLHLRAQDLAGAGGAQRALRPVDQRQPQLPLERRQLLRHRGLRVAQHARGGRDRPEVQHQRERAQPLDISEGHEATLLLVEANAVAVMPGAPHHRAMHTIDTTGSSGHAIAAGDGERIWIVADTMTLKATGESTGGSLVLIENLTAPGGGPPPHIHDREDEFFYVLDGTFEIRIGDDVHALGAGGFAFVPRGTVHNFRNTAETAGRILVGFTPGGIEGFFRESGRPATDDGPAPPVDRDEIARTMAAAPRYGVEAVAFDE